MADDVISVEESVRLTRAFVGEDADLSYITDALLQDDARGDAVDAESIDAVYSIYFGNRPRMGYRVINGVRTAITNFNGDSRATEAGACATSHSWWVNPAVYVQHHIGSCPDRSFKFKFWR